MAFKNFGENQITSELQRWLNSQNDKKFSVSYAYEKGIEQSPYSKEWSKKIKLDLGENDINDNKETIMHLWKTYTLFSGTCYKITSTLKYLKDPMKPYRIYIDFNKNLLYERSPSIDIYLTSEKNSHGIIYNEWVDGEELALKFGKVMNLYFGELASQGFLDALSEFLSSVMDI